MKYRVSSVSVRANFSTANTRGTSQPPSLTMIGTIADVTLSADLPFQDAAIRTSTFVFASTDVDYWVGMLDNMVNLEVSE